MGLADSLFVTHVMAKIDGDTYFPEIEAEIWEETHREEVPAGEKDTFVTQFARYERRVTEG